LLLIHIIINFITIIIINIIINSIIIIIRSSHVTPLEFQTIYD